MSDSPLVEIQNFSKSFGALEVIRDLSFSVNRGEIFAFLGGNGSGKTTTLRCLLQIYQSDKGTLLIDGEPYAPERADLLGYLPEERGLYLSSKVLETLLYFGQLKGLTKAVAQQRATDYLERVGLADKANLEIKKLSSGQQQKIQLGLTILNRPHLLILDEPTKGLDPVNRELLLTLLKELNAAGSTILFSTHQMEEAEKIAQRLLMIRQGRAALYGGLEEVKGQFAAGQFVVEFTGQFPQDPTRFSSEITGNKANIKLQPEHSIEQIVTYLIEKKTAIRALYPVIPSLHEIFIEVEKNDVAA